MNDFKFGVTNNDVLEENIDKLEQEIKHICDAVRINKDENEAELATYNLEDCLRSFKKYSPVVEYYVE